MQILTRGPSVDVAEMAERLAETEGLLQSERLTNELLSENYAQIELMLEDRGWNPVGATRDDLSAAGRQRARSLCRYMAVVHPLIKRGLNLRAAYVWGLGVTITAKANTADGKGQDVNAVLQAFLEANRATFTGAQASADLERALGTDGEVFQAGATDRLTGAVAMSTIPPEEIQDIVTDPDNAKVPWYYLRCYRARRLRPDGDVVEVETKVAYPAVGYRIKTHPASIRVGSSVYAVVPDTYVRHVAVNCPTGSLRGLGDAFASLPWARAHKEFLEQWATLMRALARYAYQKKTPAGKARAAAEEAIAASTAAQWPNAGGMHVAGPGYELESVSKTNATLDAESGKPLAAYVAAGLGVPVTMLLGDPGQTGARAVAETLDQPTELEMGMRRDIWAEVIDDWGQHVIDSAVIGPQGALRGKQRYDPNTGRVWVELPEEDDRTVVTSWPRYASTSIEALAKALKDFADGIPEFPHLALIRYALEALGADDIDEIIDSITDDNGVLINPDVTAGDAAVAAARAGKSVEAAYV